jgi:glycosyltransferase involved in cell wall biosynthesis
MKIDVSCVLALHGEGIVAHKTIRAINRAATYAKRGGVSSELVIVLDRATPETRRYVKTSNVIDAARVVSADFGDLGLTRNLGVELSCGEYVALFDGDDLVSENWLLKAHKINQQDAGFVVHPEVSVYFGRKMLLFYHPDQRQKEFEGDNLIVENYWTALSFARRETFLAIPYLANPPDSGFGYEDWHWNCELIARGFVHVTAAETAHFIRSKESGSLNAASALRNALIRHSSLFDSFPMQWGRSKGASHTCRKD